MSLLVRCLGVAGVVGVLAAGCGKDGPSGPAGDFNIKVAPLQLDQVSNVCYAIEVVRDAAGSTPAEKVWSKASICADKFGDGEGAITYIGACDASPDGALHTVTIAVESLEVNDIVDDRWVNPCPDNSATPALEGCQVQRPCYENRDIFVEFDLTIMRNATQGFFDIAVNFDDVFCSAKLDCSYDGTNGPLGPITLLHNPNKEGTPRDTTFVTGLACTGGAGADTQLHFDEGRLVCFDDSQTDVIVVTFASNGLEAGNRNDAPGSYTIKRNGVAYIGDEFLFQHAYYPGIEELGDYNKIYRNAAYGVDWEVVKAELGIDATCVFANTATASDGPLVVGTMYPKINYYVEVLSTGEPCGQNPLNDPNGGTAIDITQLGLPGAPLV